MRPANTPLSKINGVPLNIHSLILILCTYIHLRKIKMQLFKLIDCKQYLKKKNVILKVFFVLLVKLPRTNSLFVITRTMFCMMG